MGFSAIIAAPLVAEANAALEAQGFGPDNFSVPLWRDPDPVPASYGLNELSNTPNFKAAVETIANVSIRVAQSGAIEFDEHVASLGLKRQLLEVPE
jgi:hypothetical protein